MTTLMFPGQGSQMKGMGADLFTKFAKEVHQANDLLGYSIQELCIDDPLQRLDNTRYTQPALYVVEVLSFLDRQSRGLSSDFYIGHSLGEYSALFAAGAFDFETGLRLVQKRGELMSQIDQGSMVAVINLPVERISFILKQNGLDAVDFANLNSPKQTVLSGQFEDIAKASRLLSSETVMCVPLRVSGAFHSRYMQPTANAFAQFIAPFTMKQPKQTVISNVTAQPYSLDNIKDNLVNQISSTVKWYGCVRCLRQMGEVDFIEVGPGTVLTRLLMQID